MAFDEIKSYVIESIVCGRSKAGIGQILWHFYSRNTPDKHHGPRASVRRDQRPHGISCDIVYIGCMKFGGSRQFDKGHN